MNARDIAEALLRKGVTHRHNPLCQIAYDSRRRPPAYVESRVKRYDPQLFFRFNIVKTRWELWRWRTRTTPDARRVDPGEMVKRAVFVKTIQNPDRSYCDPDWQLLEWLVGADRFEAGEDTAAKVDRSLARDDAAGEVRQAAERDTFAKDWANDNKHQIRSITGGGRIISTPR